MARIHQARGSWLLRAHRAHSSIKSNKNTSADPLLADAAQHPSVRPIPQVHGAAKLSTRLDRSLLAFPYHGADIPPSPWVVAHQGTSSTSLDKIKQYLASSRQVHVLALVLVLVLVDKHCHFMDLVSSLLSVCSRFRWLLINSPAPLAGKLRLGEMSPESS